MDCVDKIEKVVDRLVCACGVAMLGSHLFKWTSQTIGRCDYRDCGRGDENTLECCCDDCNREYCSRKCLVEDHDERFSGDYDGEWERRDPGRVFGAYSSSDSSDGESENGNDSSSDEDEKRERRGTDVVHTTTGRVSKPKQQNTTGSVSKPNESDTAGSVSEPNEGRRRLFPLPKSARRNSRNRNP